MDHIELQQRVGRMVEECPHLRRDAGARRNQVHRLRFRLERLQQAHQLPRPDVRGNLIGQHPRDSAARLSGDDLGFHVVDGKLRREAENGAAFTGTEAPFARPLVDRSEDDVVLR